MWRLRKAKNARYNAEDFLRVFFYSEITERSIRSASERLNNYLFLHKKGNRKIYADGRKKREIPHQTDINRFLRRVGHQTARKILRECLYYQLKETLELGLISQKVNILILRLFIFANFCQYFNQDFLGFFLFLYTKVKSFLFSSILLTKVTYFT